MVLLLPISTLAGPELFARSCVVFLTPAAMAGRPDVSRLGRPRSLASAPASPHLVAMARRTTRGGGHAEGKSSYDRFKEFEGKRYTGMKVGRRHKWRYQPGEWSEQKVTPDKWKFEYAVIKRRAGKAPEGSGAPVGTAYRWYILANQIVTKQDANSYTTEMAGLKYKLAHKRADKESWSASEAAQRKRLVQILRELIAELEQPSEATTAAATDRVAGKALPSERNGAANGTRTRPANGKPAAASSDRRKAPARKGARRVAPEPTRSRPRERHAAS
jgi:hypothetical protein